MAGVCAIHPQRSSTFTCARCGDYGCGACENRVVAGAMPICSECWERRAQRVETLAKDGPSHLAWWALGLGVAALMPLFVAAQIGALVMAAVSLKRLEHDAPNRWAALVGGGLGLLGVLGSCLAMGLLASA